jgi:RNA polymerase sigma-70 factor (ECF subfamily)
MLETSATLFDRLARDPDDAAAWARLVDLYTPLVRVWISRRGVRPQDVEDRVQEVMLVLVRKLPEFRLQPRTGAFRRWLRTITTNVLRDHFKRLRATAVTAVPPGDVLASLEQLEDPDSALSREWDREHDRHVVQRLLAWIRPLFEEKTWRAFERVALEGESADAVAAELGMSVNAVFIARSRVMTRLRQEGAGLID